MTVMPDWRPHLVGTLVELRPVQADDWPALFAAASDPEVWRQHPASDRYKEDVFREFFDGALTAPGAFVAIDRQSGQVIGSSRFSGYDASESVVEIGWTFLARSHWGGRYNLEMKQLMLEHAFQYVDRVRFLIGAENIRSRTAIERIGATLIPGVEERSLNGRIVPHVVYEITRHAWRAMHPDQSP